MRQSFTAIVTVVLTTTLIPAIVDRPVFALVEASASRSGDKAGDDFLHQDIIQNPLKPPDTSSPRATLKSFLNNTNAAYSLAMAAHRENMKTGGLLTPPSIRRQQELAQRLFNRAVYCLNLQEVPDAIKKSWGV